MLHRGARGVRRLYTTNGSYLLRETMQWIERVVDPASFVRIHRSFIVNAEYVRELRTQADGERLVINNEGRPRPPHQPAAAERGGAGAAWRLTQLGPRTRTGVGLPVLDPLPS